MRATIVDTARSEWTKFHSVPSHVHGLLAGLVLMVVMGALTTNGVIEGYHGMAAEEKGTFDATYTSMHGGFLFAQVSMGALGVLMMTSEYATGTIRSSLTVVPRRGRLLAAKVGTVALITLAAGLVAGFAAFLLGQAVIAAGDAPAATLSQPGVLRAVVGMGLIWALVGLMGVALGCLLRGTTGALTVLVTINLLIPIVGPRLASDAAGEWLQKYWPITAGLRIIATVPDRELLSPWAGLALLAAVTAALLATAFATFRRRDA